MSATSNLPKHFLPQDIDVATVNVGARVALKNDSYKLHYMLPTKVAPGGARGPLHIRRAPLLRNCNCSF